MLGFRESGLGKKHRLVFGKNVNRLRQARGFTQEKLAEMIEVDRRHIQRIENGTANPGVDVICRIRIALSADWADLMDERR